MKAIATTDFGAPATLIEVPAPEPAEGEILVRVEASSINGFDLSVAKGVLKGMMEHRFPVVLGKDFAGTVEATGPGVDDFTVGETVFGVIMKPELGHGCFGELVATPVGNEPCKKTDAWTPRAGEGRVADPGPAGHSTQRKLTTAFCHDVAGRAQAADPVPGGIGAH